MSAKSDAVQNAFERELIKARAWGQAAPSVALIAAAAGVSRSSMYRFHPRIVARIQELTGQRQDAKRDQLHVKVRLLAEQLKAEKTLARALARVVAELAAEKVAMTQAFEDEKLSLQLRVAHVEKALQGRKNLRLLRP
jgi:AcrR family transcriptional regulator